VGGLCGIVKTRNWETGEIIISSSCISFIQKDDCLVLCLSSCLLIVFCVFMIVFLHSSVAVVLFCQSVKLFMYVCLSVCMYVRMDLSIYLCARTHAEHLAHMLDPVPLFERMGRCVPVGAGDKIYKTAYTQGLDVKKKHMSAYSIILDKKKVI